MQKKNMSKNRTLRISVQKRSFSGPYFSLFGLNMEIYSVFRQYLSVIFKINRTFLERRPTQNRMTILIREK